MQVRHYTKLSQQQDSVTDTRCARYETVQTGGCRAAAAPAAVVAVVRCFYLLFALPYCVTGVSSLKSVYEVNCLCLCHCDYKYKCKILLSLAKLKAAANLASLRLYSYCRKTMSATHPRYPIDDIRCRDESPNLPSNTKTVVSLWLHLLIRNICEFADHSLIPPGADGDIMKLVGW